MPKDAEWQLASNTSYSYKGVLYPAVAFELVRGFDKTMNEIIKGSVKLQKNPQMWDCEGAERDGQSIPNNSCNAPIYYPRTREFFERLPIRFCVSVRGESALRRGDRLADVAKWTLEIATSPYMVQSLKSGSGDRVYRIRGQIFDYGKACTLSGRSLFGCRPIVTLRQVMGVMGAQVEMMVHYNHEKLSRLVILLPSALAAQFNDLPDSQNQAMNDQLAEQKSA